MSTSIGNTFPAELDSLLDALKGGVTSIPPDRAVQVIDSWSSKLSGTGSPELGSIARDLDQLKSGLTSGNLAGVNSLLSGIGSKVSAISASDSSGKLSQLGEALSAGAAPSGDPSIQYARDYLFSFSAASRLTASGRRLVSRTTRSANSSGTRGS